MSSFRVAAGQPVGKLLQARRINYIQEGAELAHRLSTGTNLDPPIVRSGTALVKNDTGETVDRFGVLGISDILIDPATDDDAERSFKSHFAFVGIKPDPDSHADRFGITQAPSEDGDLVTCVLQGLTVGYIDKDEDVDYSHADLVTDDVEKLKGMDGGSTSIIWSQGGTGKQICVFNLSPGSTCPLVHEHSIFGGVPTTGSVIWSYTIDSDTQNVTIAWDDTATEVETAFTTAFSGVSAADLDVTGGPLPNVAVYVEFGGDLDVTWPPVQGTTTFDNSAAPQLRRNSPT